MTMLPGRMAYGVWCGLSTFFFALLHLKRCGNAPRRCVFRTSWAGALLRGERELAGTLRAGMFGYAAVWWAGAAGIVVSDTVRGALVLLVGGVLMIAALNAGRRVPLTARRTWMLAGALGMGGVLLLQVGAELWQTLR